MPKLTLDDLERLVHERPVKGYARPGCFSDVLPRLPAVKGAVLEWFRAALKDESKKWFVANLLASKPDVARPLTRDLVQAAMAEPDPSLNRVFVMPSSGHVTWADAVALLLEFAEAGGQVERAGVGRTAYWLRIHLADQSHDATVALNSWMLREFLRTEDIITQRCLLAGLHFEEELLDAESRSLRDSAIQKARQSGDGYVRHRIAVQLGEETGSLLPLETSAPNK